LYANTFVFMKSLILAQDEC